MTKHHRSTNGNWSKHSPRSDAKVLSLKPHLIQSIHVQPINKLIIKRLNITVMVCSLRFVLVNGAVVLTAAGLYLIFSSYKSLL